MKRILCVSISMMMLLLCSCNNTNIRPSNSNETIEKTQSETKTINSTSKKSKAPSVITDLFDGGQRLWFYLDDEEIAYDTEVSAVFVTENKTVTDFYYNLIDSGYGGSLILNKISGEAPNPMSVERFKLSDFAGLSDDEILKKIKGSYGNGASEYALTYKYFDSNEDFTLPKLIESYPFTIKYNGDLDASGNSLKNEKLSFADNSVGVDIGKGGGRYYAPGIKLKHYTVDSVISPTEIKDKTYVGLRNEKDNPLVTVNNYVSFDKVNYDNPNGATEW